MEKIIKLNQNQNIAYKGNKTLRQLIVLLKAKKEIKHSLMKKILSFPRKNKISLEELYFLEDLYIDDYTCISGYIAEPLYALA